MDEAKNKTIDEYNYTAADARLFELEALVCNLAILLGMIAYIEDLINIWVFALLVNIPLIRWMLAIHELYHIKSRIHPLLAWHLIPFTPFCIGHQEFRQLHFGHHQHTATNADPDAFHIRGGHVRSLLGAMVFPEGSTLKMFQSHFSDIDWLPVLIRLGLFTAFAYWGGMAFVYAWLALRANYLAAIWVFFHHLHYRKGEYGSFELMLPRSVIRIYTLLYGKAAVEATMHHDVHHRWPRVAARNLHKLQNSL